MAADVDITVENNLNSIDVIVGDDETEKVDFNLRITENEVVHNLVNYN